MSDIWQRRLAGALIALTLGGCSAIINPDETRFGDGEDAGAAMDASRADGGDGRDAGPQGDAGDGCPPSCDDGVACTDDRCEAGACVHQPDDALCEGGERCNPVMGCVPRVCENAAQCDDGVYCNGVERCEPGSSDTGCVPGDPVICDDGASCTEDTCDEAADSCAFTPVHERCADTVACTMERCDPAMSVVATGCVVTPDDSACNVDFCTVGRVCSDAGCAGGTPRDCADADPCTVETCNEGTDTCDSAPVDADMDGYPAASVVGPGGALVRCGGSDCDDGEASVNPGAREICGDGIDNNCAMGVDEGCLADDCGSAQPITLDAMGRGSVSGTLGALSSDYQTSPICGAQMGARDAVYYIDLPPGSWDVTIDTNGSAADTVLAIAFTCSNTGFQILCNDDQNRGVITDSRIWLHQVGQPTTTTRVFILVDGWGSMETGAYTVHVDRRTAEADSCLGPAGPFDISGGGSLLGVLRRSTSFYSGSCQSGSSGSEAIFQVRGAGTDVFDVYSSDFTPDVYLRSGTCRTGSEVGCQTGASIGGGVNRARLSATLSSGTSYYLFVDGGASGDGYAIYYEP